MRTASLCFYQSIILLLLFVSILHASSNIYQEKSLVLDSGREVLIKGKFNPESNMPVRVSGALDLYPYTNTSEAFIRFVNENQDVFLLSGEEIKIINNKFAAGKGYFNAVQIIDGRPVSSTRIMIRYGRNSKVLEWGSDIVRDKSLSWKSTLNVNQARLLVTEDCNLETVNYFQSEEIWYRQQSSAIPAYKIKIGNSVQRFIAFVDVQSGEILSLSSGIFNSTVSGNVQGFIFERNLHDNPISVPIANHIVSLDANNTTLTGENGEYGFGDLTVTSYDLEFILENDYYVINDLALDFMGSIIDQYDPYNFIFEATPPANIDFAWESTDENDFPESAINVFYHLEQMRKRVLLIDPDMEYLEGQIFVYPEQTDEFMQLNAGFMPGMPDQNVPHVIMFGTGNDTLGNFGEFTEIIMHELTHAITYHMIPVDNSDDQFRAIHEGLSDYFPGSYLNCARVGAGFFLEDTTRYLRSLDNDLIFPDDFYQDAHHDGQIIGGAFWDIREVLGRDYTDSLVHFARYGQPQSFEDYYYEILIVDDDNDNLEDGTPNSELINQVFADRGIVESNSSAMTTKNSNIPNSIELAPVYPNPFNSTARISFILPTNSMVNLKVFNMLGQEVTTITEGFMNAGKHSFTYFAGDMTSGIYFLRLEAENSVNMQKIVLIK